MSIEDITSKAQVNEVAAFEELRDRDLQVSGTVANISIQDAVHTNQYPQGNVVLLHQERQFHPLLELRSPAGSTLYCYFAKRQDVATLRVGESVTVIGTFQEYHRTPSGLIPILRFCELKAPGS